MALNGYGWICRPISGPNRICKKFREFKRTLKLRIWDSSGVVTVGKRGWEGEPRMEGGMKGRSGGPDRIHSGFLEWSGRAGASVNQRWRGTALGADRGEPDGGIRRWRGRGSEDLLSAPATPAPCLVLWSCPIPLADALPMLRGGLEVRAPPFSLTGWAPGPAQQNPPSHGWEDGPGVRAPGGSGEPGSVHVEGDGFGPRTGAAGADGADAHAEVAADGEIAAWS